MATNLTDGKVTLGDVNLVGNQGNLYKSSVADGNKIPIQSEIEASVTTNSLTAGAINPQGSANIGSENARFNTVYADTLVFSSLPLAQREVIRKPLYAGPSFPGTNGYIKCISGKVTYTYANAPIRLRIGQKATIMPKQELTCSEG